MDYPSNITGDSETVREASTFRQDEFVGTTLDGRYCLERKLGQGAFGAVYLASDEKVLSRKVVVKILHEDGTKHEWSRNKFKQEIEALSRINHPNIVAVLDSGVAAADKPFLVMQYVNGGSLRSVIKAEGMDFLSAANIIAQLGRALSAAHKCEILHRDLKPENIMLEELTDRDEHVKIIDFGVAKVKNSLVASSTVTNRAVGTIAYMSPEQLKARPLTPATDIYSLGIIAYEMVTGRRPFNPESAFQLLEFQRAGVRVKPSDLRPSLPAAADSIILKALSFDPKERYESARDFGDLLSESLRRELDQFEQGSGAQPDADREDETLSLEIGHVLCLELVGGSNLRTGRQSETFKRLQQIVQSTHEFQRARKNHELSNLFTDQSLVLMFFDSPESPVRCAMEISRALQNHADIAARMGVHSGPVYRAADIDTNRGVAGGGVDVAEWLMDVSGSNQILLSARVAEDLRYLAHWASYLHELGASEDRQGAPVQVFNFYSDEFGNSKAPAKFQLARPSEQKHRLPLRAAGLVTILALAIGGIWYAAKPKTPVVSQPQKAVTTATVGPEQSLTYWLTVQEMRHNQTLGKPVDSAGDNIFRGGGWYQFNVHPIQSGALYLLNVGPGKNGSDEYHVLFPLSKGRLDPKVAADQTAQSQRNIFDDNTGVEKLWIIWSTQPLPDLDGIFEDAVRNSGGVITKAEQLAQVDVYLKRYNSAPPEVVPDKSTKRTSLKGQGDILVNRVELSHEAY
jgi:serine/threonine protein kinase